VHTYYSHDLLLEHLHERHCAAVKRRLARRQPSRLVLLLESRESAGLVIAEPLTARAEAVKLACEALPEVILGAPEVTALEEASSGKVVQQGVVAPPCRREPVVEGEGAVVP